MRALLRRGNEVLQMTKVVGEEGTAMADFLVYLKSELLDSVYLQQDAFNEVDSAVPVERQKIVFDTLEGIIDTDFHFDDKDVARRFFLTLSQAFKDWHQVKFDAPAFAEGKAKIESLLNEQANG